MGIRPFAESSISILPDGARIRLELYSNMKRTRSYTTVIIETVSNRDVLREQHEH